jgi:hypothetical protein
MDISDLSYFQVIADSTAIHGGIAAVVGAYAIAQADATNTSVNLHLTTRSTPGGAEIAIGIARGTATAIGEDPATAVIVYGSTDATIQKLAGGGGSVNTDSFSQSVGTGVLIGISPPNT